MQSFITFFTQSSEDPSKTSATLAGLLLAGAAWAHQYLVFVPYVNEFFLSPAGQQTDAALTGIAYVIAGIWTLFGIFRKITNKIEEKVVS